jgi:hypothetical protein
MFENIGFNTPGLVNALVLRHNRLVPAGTVQSYAGPQAPSGWLLCQGQELLINDYKLLYHTL